MSESCTGRSIMVTRGYLRSLSGMSLSTPANDPQPSASFSTRKNPQCIPANTSLVFSGLRPWIWSQLLRLVTKAMPDRLLEGVAFEKTTNVTIPWRPSKLKIQAGIVVPAPAFSAGIACAGHHASGILPYDAWIPGRLFFGACSNIYGSDSHNRISRRS